MPIVGTTNIQSYYDRLTKTQQSMVLGIVLEFLQTAPKTESVIPKDLAAIEPFSLFPSIRPRDSRLVQFLRYLWSEEAIQSVRVEDFAYKAGISSSQLRVISKSDLNLSPDQVKNMFVIEKIKTALKRNQETILGISIDLGFSSQAHMTKFFKKMTALTPKQFQKNPFAQTDDKIESDKFSATNNKTQSNHKGKIS